jgi:hypothetical protein
LNAPPSIISAGPTAVAQIFWPDLKRLAAVTDPETGAAFAAGGVMPVEDGIPVLVTPK